MRIIIAATSKFRDKVNAKRASDSQQRTQQERESEGLIALNLIPSQTAGEDV